jgi:hypothetical protein
MSGFNDFLRDSLVKTIFQNAAYTTVGTRFVALFTANPNSAGGGTEVSTVGTGYNRMPMSTANWTTNAIGGVTNNAAIQFTNNAPGGWGTVTGVAIIQTSVTGAGNYEFWGPLTANVTVNAGDIVQFSSASLTITLTS